MSYELAGLIISSIATITALVQFWKNRSIKPISFNDINAIIRNTINSNEDIANSLSIDQIIDDDILKVIKDNIENAKQRLIAVLGDPAYTTADKDKEVEIACSIVCAELRRIRRLNQNKLPTPSLERLWNTHACVAIDT